MGVILALYSITEFLGGSGAIGRPDIRIMLGNEKSVRSIIHMDETEEKVPIKEFHTEVSFIVRTFFFVFLGMVVTLTSINATSRSRYPLWHFHGGKVRAHVSGHKKK